MRILKALFCLMGATFAAALLMMATTVFAQEARPFAKMDGKYVISNCTNKLAMDVTPAKDQLYCRFKGIEIKPSSPSLTQFTFVAQNGDLGFKVQNAVGSKYSENGFSAVLSEDGQASTMLINVDNDHAVLELKSTSGGKADFDYFLVLRKVGP